jgi:hypothetical protein
MKGFCSGAKLAGNRERQGGILVVTMTDTRRQDLRNGLTDIQAIFKPRVSVWVFSRFSTLVIRSLLGRVVASLTPVSLATSTGNMTRASKANTGGKKSQGPGRNNTFSGVKLEFLETFKDQFLGSLDRGAFYELVSKEFIEKFGYDLPIGDNPEPDDADDKHTKKEIDPSLSIEEQKIESDRRSALYRGLQKVSQLLIA